MKTMILRETIRCTRSSLWRDKDEKGDELIKNPSNAEPLRLIKAES